MTMTNLNRYIQVKYQFVANSSSVVFYFSNPSCFSLFLTTKNGLELIWKLSASEHRMSDYLNVFQSVIYLNLRFNFLLIQCSQLALETS